MIERRSTAPGQLLFVPEIEAATYWTSLSDTAEEILPWYPDHGTMEQYHAEYKTDLDPERLPSGKVATNSLIMEMAALAFNILRVMGQATLAYENVPLRKSATRRRLRTVVRHLITCAAKVVRQGRTIYLRYADTNPWYCGNCTPTLQHPELSFLRAVYLYRSLRKLHHRPPVFPFQRNGSLALVEPPIYRALQVVPAK